MQVRTVIVAMFGTLMWTAPAFAADTDNFANFVQLGNSHNGFVDQTGTGNQAGTTTDAVTQTGFNNNVEITQSGNNNTLGILGDGVFQNGVISNDHGQYANSAVIVQNSNGNEIGELVQTSNSDHVNTGNAVTVKQDVGDSNTIISIRQTQAAGAASNFAEVVQTGELNWLQGLSQITASNEGPNHITYQATGNHNGLNSNSNGAGTLSVLAQSTGATASSLIQGQDLSGGSGNTMSLIITRDYNQFGMTQYGVDNSAGVTMTGNDNSFGSFQMGRHNEINTGGIAGDSNDMGIRQVGSENFASAVLHWSSSDNSLGLGQSGDGNRGDVSFKGDLNIVGLSQLGRGNTAKIDGENGLLNVRNNAVVVVQANAGNTNSIGNSAMVTLNGDNNNSLFSGRVQAFSGAALALAQSGPLIPSSLLLAPDVTTLLIGHSSRLLATPGTMIQWGEGNRLQVDVGKLAAADDNLFSVLQQGGGNTLVASIEGSFNQMVALQIGDDNVGVIDQSGTGNVVALSQ